MIQWCSDLFRRWNLIRSYIQNIPQSVLMKIERNILGVLWGRKTTKRLEKSRTAKFYWIVKNEAKMILQRKCLLVTQIYASYRKFSNYQSLPPKKFGWVSGFLSVNGNRILVSAIMKKLKNGCHFVNMQRTEFFLNHWPPPPSKFGSLVYPTSYLCVVLHFLIFTI